MFNKFDYSRVGICNKYIHKKKKKSEIQTIVTMILFQLETKTSISS